MMAMSPSAFNRRNRDCPYFPVFMGLLEHVPAMIRNIRYPRALASLLMLVVLSGGTWKECLAMELPTYHLRSDLEKQFDSTSSQEAAFWNDSVWKSRPVFSTTLPRSISTGLKDGSVTISAKAVATVRTLYLYMDFTYSQKAPDATSLDIPLDGITLLISRYAFGATSGAGYYQWGIIFSEEAGNIRYCDVQTGGSTCSNACKDNCAKYVQTDSLHRFVEVSVPCSNIMLDPPHAGACKAIELRYHCHAAQGYSAYRAFVPDDTITVADRVLLGDLVMESDFDVPVYVLLSPASGSVLTSGNMHTIAWGTTVQAGFVGLDFSADNGRTWEVISVLTENDGSYPWIVPTLTSDSCLLRMRAEEGDGAVSDRFSIGCGAPKLFPIADSAAQPAFRWLPVENTESYRILIAATADFSAPIVDDMVSGESYFPQTPLPQKLLYWKVSATSGCIGFSAVDSFVNISAMRANMPVEGLHNKTPLAYRTYNRYVYRLTAPGTVRVELVTPKGARVAILDAGYRNAGTHTVEMTGLSRSLSSGVYFVRIITENRSDVFLYVMTR